MKIKMNKLLIIDDDAGISEMLKTLLEFNGYEAVATDKPLQAKETIQKYRPDLILLDVRLSGVDGTEVCANLKKDKATADVPILMMSALSGADKTCEQAGADGFVAKPFGMEDLLKKVKEVLSGQQKKTGKPKTP
ncbi:response regulator transcription factor [Salinimicrobium sp. WS361]|uniref:response regulator transcription factor n=1 Tax=Salinimicrobium sp. WS361 TaxID=3425123 RepID=UPI003D6EA3F2